MLFMHTCSTSEAPCLMYEGSSFQSSSIRVCLKCKEASPYQLVVHWLVVRMSPNLKASPQEDTPFSPLGSISSPTGFPQAQRLYRTVPTGKASISLWMPSRVSSPSPVLSCGLTAATILKGKRGVACSLPFCEYRAKSETPIWKTQSVASLNLRTRSEAGKPFVGAVCVD